MQKLTFGTFVPTPTTAERQAAAARLQRRTREWFRWSPRLYSGPLLNNCKVLASQPLHRFILVATKSKAKRLLNERYVFTPHYGVNTIYLPPPIVLHQSKSTHGKQVLTEVRVPQFIDPRDNQIYTWCGTPTSGPVAKYMTPGDARRETSNNPNRMWRPANRRGWY